MMEKVARAAATCLCGLSRFTADDPVEGSRTKTAIPRGTVLLEAGYFTSVHPARVALLTEAEVAALLAATDPGISIGAWDRALLLLVAVQTGLRNSEFTSLRRQEFEPGTGALPPTPCSPSPIACGQAGNSGEQCPRPPQGCRRATGTRPSSAVGLISVSAHFIDRIRP